MLKDCLIAKISDSAANAENVFVFKNVRFSVLTERLLRIEKSESGRFEDKPTQTFWHRNFEAVPFSHAENGDVVTIATARAKWAYDAKSGKLKSVEADGKTITDFDSGNLLGTRRTLDFTFGKVPLDKGLMSKNGVATVSDEKSFVLEEDGWVRARAHAETDDYVFAYGRDYRGELRDFFRLSGAIPLIPRFALGVWWSRYRAYTQEEYLALMDKFRDEVVPLTVATVDMDWHYVDVKNKFHFENTKGNASYGGNSGWTGYTWNEELFPDHKQFLKDLKARNLHVTLNLHPADGIRWFEDCYGELCEKLGIDKAAKEQIKLSFKSDKFLNNYFDVVHKPYEKEGVDFWWIDWQQGKMCDVEGLDPLWPLNHYHYLDNAENGQLPLILSRYAGLGSHRYPLGFSGDTAINWRVFDFQPYFTANAANVGYTWWSHDIGGHHFGARDDELYLRWAEFGVFSPIMRLHSTSNDLLGKEPWRYPKHICELTEKYLRLRHRMIPYLYSMDYLSHKTGRALCEPMYYEEPNSELCYKVPNEYRFGTELVVCPITEKVAKATNTAATNVYIPKGRYTDIFTGAVYEGGKNCLQTLSRGIADIPVLAKAGAVIPLSMDEGNGTANPRALECLIYRGNSEFTLYEDNGGTDFEEHNAKTYFTVSEEEDKQVRLFVRAETNDESVLPRERTFKFTFKDLLHVKSFEVKVDGEKREVEAQKQESGLPFFVTVTASPLAKIEIAISDYDVLRNPSDKEHLVAVMSHWQTSTTKKSLCYNALKNFEGEELRKKIAASGLPKAVKRDLFEFIN